MLGILESKERSSLVESHGMGRFGTGTIQPHHVSHMEWQQHTETSQNPLFLYLQKEKRKKVMPAYWRDFMSRQDLGDVFLTEKGSLESDLRSVDLHGKYFTSFVDFSWQGPLFLAGFASPLPFASEPSLVDAQATLFALGGTAIARCRPGKPTVDLATAIGEFKKDGIPSLIGSLFVRSRNVRDVFRNGGNEYLNAQFGWLPLVRDVQGLAQVALNTRRILEGHEKKLNKLLKRTYRYTTLIDTVQGLTKTLPNYELTPSQSIAGSQVGTGTQLGYQVPVEITRSVTKSHFSGGFRFYYPEIQSALDSLLEIEHNANILLGTRLDPEVLWNLSPWSWLVDWFINFGDVLGNLSALITDGLVIQYAYMMQEVSLQKEITIPRGLRYRNMAGGMSFTEKPWTTTQSYVRKMRVKAHPFGFGLTPEMFTPQQWAILAALGISRGLK